MDPKFDVTKLYHRCTGKDCTFCAWRVNNPISIGWEALFNDPVESCSNDADKSAEIVDEMCILNEEDIEKLDKIEMNFRKSKSLSRSLQLTLSLKRRLKGSLDKKSMDHQSHRKRF